MSQPSLLPQERKVEAIRNGTVIDHIRAGRGTILLKALSLVSGDRVISAGLNFKSKMFGKKDIVKIEDHELTKDDLARIAVISPGATVNVIRDYVVAEKSCPAIPDEIRGLSKCPNPNCITRSEPMTPHFLITKTDNAQLRCRYCEKLFTFADLDF